MPSTLSEQITSDIDYFNAVRGDPHLVAALSEFGLVSNKPKRRQHNAVFVITKPAWNIVAPPGVSCGLNIHFEARKRNEFRIEVGLNPYIGNIENKPELKQELIPVLKMKLEILASLRSLLTTPGLLPAHIQVSTSSLLNPDKVKSHTIVKFTGGLVDEPESASAAHFFAQVIRAVTPAVERDMLGR